MAPAGSTSDGTWQFGVRRTARASVAEAWVALRDLAGSDALVGDVRSETPNVVARFRYRDPAWDRDATLQIRVLAAATGATLAVHLEGLPDEAARIAAAERWTPAVEQLAARLSGE